MRSNFMSDGINRGDAKGMFPPYVQRHLRGELSFVYVFWVNTVVLNAVLFLFVHFLPDFLAFVFIGPFYVIVTLILLFVFVAQIAGLWQCASHSQIEFTGLKDKRIRVCLYGLCLLLAPVYVFILLNMMLQASIGFI